MSFFIDATRFTYYARSRQAPRSARRCRLHRFGSGFRAVGVRGRIKLGHLAASWSLGPGSRSAARIAPPPFMKPANCYRQKHRREFRHCLG